MESKNETKVWGKPEIVSLDINGGTEGEKTAPGNDLTHVENQDS
jgi:hypothetical protein